MFRLFNSFFALLLTIIVLKWLLPPELADLATQILVKILTIIRDLLATITLPT
jgi:hypothetical protein